MKLALAALILSACATEPQRVCSCECGACHKITIAQPPMWVGVVKVRKVLAPGHGFNSERSQRAENGGRP